MTRGAGSWRLGVAALLVVPLLATVFTVVPVATPVANAALHNPIPMNSSEEPADLFVDTDALFVYVTSDLAGGTVCIVEATVESPEEGSCDSPAWGSPNFIIGIGSVIQPIEGPHLWPGTWKLLTENTDGTGTGLSGEFTVMPCDTCSTDIGDEAIGKWKQRAQESQFGAALYCSIQELRDKVDAVMDIGSVEASWSANDVPLITIVYSPVGGGFAFMVANPFEVLQEKALEILKDLSCAVSNMYGDIVADPPDFGYATVAPPVIGAVAPMVSPEETALATAIARQVGYGGASLTAFERYLGAKQDNDTAGVIRQAKAVADNSQALVNAVRDTATALDGFAAYADTQPEFSGPLAATQSEVDDLAAGYARVRNSGFTGTELQQLHDLGLTDAQIADFRTNFDRDLSVLSADMTLGDAARDLANTLRATLVDLDAFAREAAAVAARNELLVPDNTPPIANFTVSPGSGVAPLVVTFDASLSSDPDGTINSYSWDFGDGATGTGTSVQHTYTAAGTYVATLTVTDNNGATASTTRQVTATTVADALPIASFTATPNSGDAPLNVSFNASASSDAEGPIAAYAWSFGDGATDAGATSTHTYGQPGSYTAALTVTDGGGQTATTTRTIIVSQQGNQPPVARFDRTPSGGPSPLLVSFDGYQSSDPDGFITSFDWNFGDGSIGSGFATEHTFTTTGVFDVTLTVTDNGGLTSSVTRPVTVQTGNVAPDVDVGPDVTLVESGRYFYRTPAIQDPDGTIESTEWNFGDGTLSSDLVASHQYAAKGAFTVTLTVTDNDGAVSSDSLVVTVINENPVINEVRPPQRTSPGVESLVYGVFYDPGELDVVTGIVDFGDGTPTVPVESAIQVLHTWIDPGTYTVTLTVDDGAGGTATATASVLVKAPTIDAGPDRTGDEGQELTFVRALDGAQDPASSVIWDFGDGNTTAVNAADASPVRHAYRDSGTYTLTLTLYGGSVTEPITDTATVTLANVAPTVTGVATTGQPEANSRVSFNVFIADAGIEDTLDASWDFGDGVTATGTTVEHTYATPGTYTALVTASDDDGGVSTATATVVTVHEPNTAPEAIDSSGRDFWLAFNRNYSGVPELTLFITAPTSTSGTVEIPGIGFSTPFSVTAGTVTSVLLPEEASLDAPASGELKIEPRGIHVRAQADVSVYGLNYITYTTDAFLGLPTDVLGTDYRVMTYPAGSQQEVSVVGTANDTVVTFTPTASLTGAHDAGVPFTATVDIGEVLNLPDVAFGDLTGTRIQSNRPIAVFSGNNCANVPTGVSFCDYLIEQLTPTSTWGRRFVTTPLASRQNGDTFRILAATDGTEVQVNGGVVATLDAGQFHEQILTVASLIEASAPVLVAQFANGSQFSGQPGDPFMMLIPPYEQFLNSYIVTTPASGFVQSYISIVARGDGAGIALDGSLVPTASFAPIGTSGYSGAAIPVEPGTHRLSAAQPFGLAIYGFNNDDSYGYTGGLSLSEVARVIQVDLTPASANATVGESTCVTGTATDAVGDPVTGVRMDFAVTGVNPTSGFALTDAAGAAEFCYVGTAEGLDTITGTVSGISDTATRTWSIESGNHPPTADPKSVTTPEDTAAAVTLFGSDVDGDVLTFAVVTQPAHGTLSGSGSARTYTPNPDYNGPDSFTYSANDGSSDSNNATVTITVTPVNDAPTADPKSVTTPEGIAVAVALSGSDIDGDTLTFVVATGPAHGTLSGSGASRTYTPSSNYNGPDSFTYAANDGTTDSNAVTVTISVTPVNLPPAADPKSVTTSEDTAVAVTLSGSDVDGDTLTFVVVAQPAQGTLSGSGSTRTYTPNPDYNGPDSFTYKANDGSSDSNIATVTISVTPVNDAPTADPKSVTTPEDVSVAVTLSGSDIDGDTLTFAVVTQPAHGTLSGSGASRTYTPSSNYNGPDSFTYAANDGTTDSNAVTVTISVTPVNLPPAADPKSVTTSEDTAVAVTLSGSDPDGDALTFTVVSQPAHGALSGSGSTRTYTPNLNYNGPDSFTYKANDGTVDSNLATVSISVTPVNDPPVSVPVSVTTPRDVPVGVALSATDLDGDTVTFIVVTQPAHGALSGSGTSRTYTPDAGYAGPDSFTYMANDGTADSNTATVTITVTATNRPPTADPKSVTTPEDTAVGVTLSGSDLDGDALTFTIVTQPAHGGLSGSGANRTYTPNPDYNGPDSFTYKANDGTTDSDVATVTISVTAVNDVPTVTAPQSVTGTEGSPVTIAAGTADVDGDALTVTWTVAAGADVDAGASCTIGAQAATTTIACSDNGTYTATVTVSDGAGGIVSASTTMTITNANPVVAITSAPSGQVQPGASFDLAASVSDPGANDSHTCIVNWGDGSSSPGTVSNLTCAASHAYATAGTKTAVVTLTDDDGGSGSAGATITVATVTPPPPVSGCVRGENYWLEHSKPKSKAYDKAWDAVGGPSAKFLSSGVSWKSALAKYPNGSAYWILAGEYIVATLNVAAGASASSEIQAALASAKTALAATTPKKGERDRNLMRIADVLERFNDGKAGPKRCGDDHGPPHPPCRSLFLW